MEKHADKDKKHADIDKKTSGKEMETLSRKIEIYSEEITERNFKNFKSFAFGGMILTGLIALTALVCWGHVYFTREYCILFIHFILCNGFVHLYLKNHIEHTLPSFYVAMAPILTIGIFMGTFLDPGSNAMTVMIMLCTLFMFITDKPQHIIGYILGTTVIFLICSYQCKPRDLFVSDLVNIAIYLSIGLSVNMLTLTDRVNSAENFVLATRRADCDALTSILNRGAGDRIVKRMLQTGKRGAFIILDIDDFKSVNDNYGHQAGDDVICAVSRQLKAAFRDRDVIWRLGGDEFAVFAVGLESREKCGQRLRQLQEGLAVTGISEGKTLTIQISAGCSICSTSGLEFDAVYKSSDDALYEAKQNGKNGYVICEYPRPSGSSETRKE